MPRTLTVYLKATDVPTRKVLQKAVDELKFRLKLDEAYTPFEMAGYLPCILNGEDAGFDMWFKNRPSEFTLPPLYNPASETVTLQFYANGVETRAKQRWR